MPPGQHDGQPEQGVRQDENPGWHIVVEKPMQPVADKAAAVGWRPGLLAQPHLQGGERADGAEPGLGGDDRDGGQVRQPEPQAIDPAPTAPVAEEDDHQAANHKESNGKMQHEHHIGKEEEGEWRIHGWWRMPAMRRTVVVFSGIP